MNIEELVDNFALFDNWEDRYAYLIGLGGKLPPMPEVLKIEACRVKGCMSQVWMVLSWDEDGRLQMVADSDALIVKGLIAVLQAAYAGKTQAEIATINIDDVFREIGLDVHLSANRRNGFYSMVETIKAFTGRYT